MIYLFQAGAPSQLDLFDFKPTLVKYDGKTIPPFRKLYQVPPYAELPDALQPPGAA